MKISNETIQKGFILSGLMNVFGVIIFSRFFTNPVIPEVDGDVMSIFGLVMIVVWGFAYIAVAKHFHFVKWLILVFAIEKLIYGIVWIKWLSANSLPGVFEKDTMAGIFYTIYGANDWLFFAFFLLVFIRLINGGAKG